MIIMRDFKPEDVPGIDEVFHKQQFGVPSLNHVFVNKVIEQDGRIIAYGVVKQFAEAVLILDQTLPIRTKAEVVKQVIPAAAEICANLGLEQLYLTTNNEGYAQTLQKRYGFIQCSTPYYLLNLG
jgi:N-acetylglutamate synthase-like GNAT family acetyltransferase